jgi:hypothetical protein
MSAEKAPQPGAPPDLNAADASTHDEPDAVDLATAYFDGVAMDVQLVDMASEPAARWASIDSLIEAGGRDPERLSVGEWLCLAIGLELVGEVAA